jgi:hypothetical protein
VLELTLHDDGWSSRFLPVDGAFSDDVEGACH